MRAGRLASTRRAAPKEIWRSFVVISKGAGHGMPRDASSNRIQPQYGALKRRGALGGAAVQPLRCGVVLCALAASQGRVGAGGWVVGCAPPFRVWIRQVLGGRQKVCRAQRQEVVSARERRGGGRGGGAPGRSRVSGVLYLQSSMVPVVQMGSAPNGSGAAYLEARVGGQQRARRGRAGEGGQGGQQRARWQRGEETHLYGSPAHRIPTPKGVLKSAPTVGLRSSCHGRQAPISGSESSRSSHSAGQSSEE